MLQRYNTTPNVKPAINTLLFIQHLIQKNKTLQYCMQVCFGNCDWFEMADMIYNFVSEKSKKYFSGSTILQRTTKKPLYLTMTACAVCSSVGNSFHTYFGSYVFLWPVPGINIICSKAFVWNNTTIHFVYWNFYSVWLRQTRLTQCNRTPIQYLHQGTPICTDKHDLSKPHLERSE